MIHSIGFPRFKEIVLERATVATVSLCVLHGTFIIHVYSGVNLEELGILEKNNGEGGD